MKEGGLTQSKSERLEVNILCLYFEKEYFFMLSVGGVEAKRGVEFRHTTRKVSKIRGTECLTLGSLCLPCYVRDTA